MRLPGIAGAPAGLINALNTIIDRLENPTAPSRIYTVATLTAVDAADWRDRVVIARDTGKLHRSNGTNWSTGVTL